jgi:hypothetical protein
MHHPVNPVHRCYRLAHIFFAKRETRLADEVLDVFDMASNEVVDGNYFMTLAHQTITDM